MPFPGFEAADLYDDNIPIVGLKTAPKRGPRTRAAHVGTRHRAVHVLDLGGRQPPRRAFGTEATRANRQIGPPATSQSLEPVATLPCHVDPQHEWIPFTPQDRSKDDAWPRLMTDHDVERFACE